MHVLKTFVFIRDDIADFKFLNEKFDAILHFATPANAKLNIEKPSLMTSIITDGMKRILDFAVHTEVKDFLFASSGAVYGAQPFDLPHTPETFSGPPHPHALDVAYGEAKRYVPNIQKTKIELGLDVWTTLHQAIQLSAKKINR
ncbi:MAG: NAD-dependent epimerase/dehydratase family protein [Pseudobdellovibrio sp.]